MLQCRYVSYESLFEAGSTHQSQVTCLGSLDSYDDNYHLWPDRSLSSWCCQCEAGYLTICVSGCSWRGSIHLSSPPESSPLAKSNFTRGVEATADQSGGAAAAEEVGVFTGETTGNNPLYHHLCRQNNYSCHGQASMQCAVTFLCGCTEAVP